MQKSKISPYLFILPSGIFFLAFTLTPIIFSVVLTTFEWTAVTSPRFVGLSNWIRMFGDYRALRSLMVTVRFVLVIVPLNLAISLFLAFLVDSLGRVTKVVFRSVFFMPVVTSAVAISFIMNQMFRRDAGIINYYLSYIGISPVPWLTSTFFAFIACVIFIVWGMVGSSMIIMMAGLQGVPSTYYEAAEIDGCNAFKKFFKITVPLIAPSIFFVIITTTIGSMQIFDQIFLITRGGPGYATQTIMYEIITAAFTRYQMGYASTLSFILLILLMIITIVQWKFHTKWVHYE